MNARALQVQRRGGTGKVAHILYYTILYYTEMGPEGRRTSGVDRDDTPKPDSGKDKGKGKGTPRVCPTRPL